MLTEELGRCSRAVLGHPLPERDGAVRVVASHGHENQPEAIGFALLQTTLREHGAHLRPYPKQRHPHILRLLGL